MYNIPSDSLKTLIFVHIGKCGGSTLRTAIRRSEKLHRLYDHIETVHVRKPPLHAYSRYMLVLRNPISRTLSAFNWRFRLVVDGNKHEGSPGEREVLKKYGDLNTLAQNLYTGNSLNEEVAREMKLIGHIKKDMVFYLDDLVKSIDRDQIFAVLVNERLDSDIEKFLSVERFERKNQNGDLMPKHRLSLSEAAVENLRLFLRPEYEVIQRVLAIYSMDEKAVRLLLA